MFALEFIEFYQKNQIVAVLDLLFAILYFVVVIAAVRTYSKLKKSNK